LPSYLGIIDVLLTAGMFLLISAW